MAIASPTHSREPAVGSARSCPGTFVLGRQHSGNTMLVTALARLPGMTGMRGESAFFEHLTELHAAGAAARPGQVARLVAEACDPPLRDAEREDLVALLEAAVRSGIDQPIALFECAMQRLASRAGAGRWVQKATSYVFYIDEILAALPEAQLIFVLRNPFDLAASVKRRDGILDVVRMLAGWNRGVALAQRALARYSARFGMVRYEDFVTWPEREMRRLCHFLGIDYRADALDIPHVNRAATPYNQVSDEQGVQRTRCHAFDRELTPAEQLMIRIGTRRGLLAAFYPELTDRRVRLRHLPGALALLAGGALRLTGRLLRAMLNDPSHTLRRIARRT